MICLDVLYVSIGIVALLCGLKLIQINNELSIRRKKQIDRTKRKFNIWR
jgi:hypothetical protein